MAQQMQGFGSMQGSQFTTMPADASLFIQPTSFMQPSANFSPQQQPAMTEEEFNIQMAEASLRGGLGNFAAGTVDGGLEGFSDPAMMAQMGQQGGKEGKGKGGKPKGKAGATKKIEAGEILYIGRVRSYDVDRAHGFVLIDARETDMDGKEVYCHQKVLHHCSAGPGDLACFFLHWNPRGQAQVSLPCLRLSAFGTGNFALKGIFKPGNDPSKGHGFFVCPEVKDFFGGKDVYVNKELASNFYPGATVKFNAYLNYTWHPNADHAELCDEDWMPMPGDLSVSSRVDIGKGKGGMIPVGGKGTGFGGGPPDFSYYPTGTGKLCEGVIKEIKHENGHAVVEMDVYTPFHKIEGMNLGEKVVFELAFNWKNQAQATNLSTSSVESDYQTPPQWQQSKGQQQQFDGQQHGPLKIVLPGKGNMHYGEGQQTGTSAFEAASGLDQGTFGFSGEPPAKKPKINPVSYPGNDSSW